MNAGFRELAAGVFKSGLAKLDEDPEWHDDRTDLDGPFRLKLSRGAGLGRRPAGRIPSEEACRHI